MYSDIDRYVVEKREQVECLQAKVKRRDELILAQRERLEYQRTSHAQHWPKESTERLQLTNDMRVNAVKIEQLEAQIKEEDK